MTITEFLTARLDEDGEVVVALRTRTPPRRHPKSWRADLTTDEQGADGITLSPERMLAEVAAKRAIVVMHRQIRLRDIPGAGWKDVEKLVCEYDTDPDGSGYTAYPCTTLQLLAQPYAEHPDFDPDWKISTPQSAHPH
jgi:hypothetical protein